MADDSINFSPSKAKIWVGLIASIIGVVGTAWAYGGSYHSKFATSQEIYTLAIQDKEDRLALIEFKEGNGTATPEDAANKQRILRRLADLKRHVD